MGIFFQRRKRIAKNTDVNLSKSGASVSSGWGRCR